MTRLTRLAACAAALMACGVGCGPRADVAKQRVLDRIDDALGRLDVQRAEVAAGVKAARKAADGVRKARVKAQVQLDLIDEKVRPFEERVAQCEATGSRMADLLKADKPAEIAGRTYSVAELRGMGAKVVQARKAAERQIAGFKTARDSLGKVVADLGERQAALEVRVSGFEAKLVTLDAELAAAKAVKAAAAGVGDGDATLTASLDELDGKIAGLTADVRAQLQEEGSNRLLTRAEQEVADVDAFIRATQKPADLLAELTPPVGGKK